jgi:hypothetical protein
MRTTRQLVSALVLASACGGAGDDWHEVANTPHNFGMLDVWAFSATDVWFVDGGSRVHRFDGQAWSTLDTPGSGLSCIFALSASDVYLCAGTAVVRYDGASFTKLEVTATTGLDGIADLWAASPSDVWAIGDDAIVAHYNGTSWSRTLTGGAFAESIWAQARPTCTCSAPSTSCTTMARGPRSRSTSRAAVVRSGEPARPTSG